MRTPSQPGLMPQPGHVYIARTGARAPYAQIPSLVLDDVQRLDASSLAALLSAPSSDSSISTSALEGLLSKLTAMALAVRNRSYVLIAASISDWGMGDSLVKTLNLASNASVASFTSVVDMVPVSFFEIDHCDAAQPPHCNHTYRAPRVSESHPDQRYFSERIHAEERSVIVDVFRFADTDVAKLVLRHNCGDVRVSLGAGALRQLAAGLLDAAHDIEPLGVIAEPREVAA